MDTEIINYHGEEYSLQLFSSNTDSMLFPMHGNSLSSEHLQEIEVTNNFVSGAIYKWNINLNIA